MKNNNNKHEIKKLAVVETASIMDFSNAIDITYPDILRINKVFKESPHLAHFYFVKNTSVTMLVYKKYDKSFYELNMFYTKDKDGNAVFCDVLFSDFIHVVFVIAFLWV